MPTRRTRQAGNLLCLCFVTFAVHDVTAAEIDPALVNPSQSACGRMPNISGLPFCDPSKSVDSRVANLVSLMTQAEKVELMAGQGTTTAVPRLAVPALPFGEVCVIDICILNACDRRLCMVQCRTASVVTQNRRYPQMKPESARRHSHTL